MPWFIEQREEKYCVVKGTKESPLEVEKCHEAEQDAVQHMRALYASEKGVSEDRIKFCEECGDLATTAIRDFKENETWMEGIGEAHFYCEKHSRPSAKIMLDGSLEFSYATPKDELEAWTKDIKEKHSEGGMLNGSVLRCEPDPKETMHPSNALKAISQTDDELRAANYIVLFGGRDLEGIASDNKNQDGSRGEFFTNKTALDSTYTQTGVLYVDWEHGRGKALDGEDAPGRDDVLGFVDWKTAQVDERGVWVERVLNRRNRYMRFLETLIGEGLVGNSSEAIPGATEKTPTGEIVKWPLRRDTLTVQPMEPRMLTENAVSALKSLGVYPEPEPEAQPEVEKSAVEAAQIRVDIESFLISLL